MPTHICSVLVADHKNTKMTAHDDDDNNDDGAGGEKTFFFFFFIQKLHP
jgi:hypothetical protein